MFHKIIKNQGVKLSRLIDQLNVDDKIFYNKDVKKARVHISIDWQRKYKIQIMNLDTSI